MAKSVTADPEIAERVMEQCIDPQTYYSCFPHESQVIPRKGRWIIVREVPHTALAWEVPLYSIWRARRVIRKRRFKVSYRGPAVNWPLMLAEITTPGGDLTLYPTEYVGTTLEKWLDLIGEGVTMHFIGEGTPGELADAIFYMQAHGISRQRALLAILPQLTDSRFVYFMLDWEHRG